MTARFTPPSIHCMNYVPMGKQNYGWWNCRPVTLRGQELLKTIRQNIKKCGKRNSSSFIKIKSRKLSCPTKIRSFVRMCLNALNFFFLLPQNSTFHPFIIARVMHAPITRGHIWVPIFLTKIFNDRWHELHIAVKYC